MGERDVTTYTMTINGRQETVTADPRLLLVDVIRDVVGLRATHVGCLTGDCGACTVLVDGSIAKSCLSLGMAAEGRSVVTLEGETSDIMAALRAAFIARNAFQCGFCTAGFLMVAADLLRHEPRPNEAAIRHALNGNLCRCTGYEPIVNAIQDAARQLQRD
ncbi:MAG: 4-hydroxybenzoyl-CoA reductase subunit gamma [Enterovirga sp.]|jgi:carbon-monoxide dehydrogenase small subunit|nr:4-hydroxybenzoyl-CoA reductase subunit gamma [Enterovirga sp.]